MIDAGALLRRPGALWLDTAAPLGSAGAWSFLAAEPAVRLELRGDDFELRPGPAGDRGLLALLREADPGAGPPFDRLVATWRRAAPSLRLAPAPDHPADRAFAPIFRGGLAGLLSYDLGRRFERLPARLPEDGRPDVQLGLYDEVIALRPDGAWFRFRLRGPRGEGGGPGLVDDDGGHGLLLPDPPALGPVPGPFPPDLDRQGHRAAVESIRESIGAGAVYQVNLTFRQQAPAAPDAALPVHLRLRRANPAPYAAYLDLPERRIVSASPESFLVLDRAGRVRSRPIKGTRPRGADPAADRALREELLGSAKDDAELAMIIDLVRNDLARSCVPGSVSREARVLCEGHPTVWHTVGQVDGRLRADRDAWDLVRAAFPPGSCIGAPKIAAAGRIEALEASRRGPYTGALGWIGADGGCALSVLIRTLVFEDGLVRFGAGGGIVHDSGPESEWTEALLKSAALRAALAGGEPGPVGPET